MLKHLFKLIWNKKKQNFLLITEMFVSFIVMFAVFTLMVYYYHNYKQPTGFEYDNVWVVNYATPQAIGGGTANDAPGHTDSSFLFQETLKKMLMSMPQIAAVSFTSPNVPFSMSSSNTEVSDSKHRHVRTNVYQTEDSYQSVLNFKMIEGRWFNATDNVNGKYTPIVINEKLKEELFGNESGAGKIIGEEQFETGTSEEKFKVIGVANNMKDKGDYQAVENGMYRRTDTGGAKYISNILLRVKPGADAAFEAKLFKSLSNAIGSSVEIEHMDKKLVTKNKIMIVPLIIALIVVGFLIINVALGLFGVLWYNINKRRGEIGLRRAVGATGNSVSKQLVGEALVLSTFALIIGSFFAVQFPLLNVFDLPASVYIFALVFAVIFVYVLVILCALYPGKQAAAIYPAVALHEE